MLEPRIETLEETRLVGKRSRMSFAGNTTARLWKEFMPQRGKIGNVVDGTFYSVEVYEDPDFFRDFDPFREFEKWAAVPVHRFDCIPAGLETLLIPAGVYAVFRYRGKESEVSQMYQYIYGSWIPNSRYTLDHRPHFARMGPAYKGEDPDSEEELWIPVREK
ncbi:MAG: GyrI-like domain-containing protein [Robiginitalea sp.]|nr:GyrI-like domain-containing protein [Robiginitalea sp.]